MMDESQDSKTPEPAANSATEPAAKAATPAPEPRVSIDQFFDIQLRVAQIVAAERIEKTDKLMKLEIDLGDERRQIVAGIAAAYEVEQVVGRRIIVVANLKPARIRGVESNGMLLAGDLDGRPILAGFDEDVPLGTRVR
jgi:methionine--tRNA ligase beta chain